MQEEKCDTYIINLRDRSIRKFYAYMEKEVEPPKPISY